MIVDPRRKPRIQPCEVPLISPQRQPSKDVDFGKSFRALAIQETASRDGPNRDRPSRQLACRDRKGIGHSLRRLQTVHRKDWEQLAINFIPDGEESLASLPDVELLA